MAIQSPTTGDFNGDKHDDLVVADSLSDAVTVFLGLGEGAFTPGIRYPVGPREYTHISIY